MVSLPFYLKCYDHKPLKRAMLPWWATAALGLVLVLLAMLPGDS